MEQVDDSLGLRQGGAELERQEAAPLDAELTVRTASGQQGQGAGTVERAAEAGAVPGRSPRRRQGAWSQG